MFQCGALLWIFFCHLRSVICLCLCHDVLSASCSLVVTGWEKADLLALFILFPICHTKYIIQLCMRYIAGMHKHNLSTSVHVFFCFFFVFVFVFCPCYEAFFSRKWVAKLVLSLHDILCTYYIMPL